MQCYWKSEACNVQSIKVAIISLIKASLVFSGDMGAEVS